MSDPHPTGAADRPFSWVLALIAFLPRLYVASAWPREPVWDAHYYDFGARRIAAGLGYSEDVMRAGVQVWHPTCHYPVGYSALLGALYRVLGPGTLVAPLLNAVLGAVTAVLVHRLALRWLSPDRARVAGALVALHPGLIAYTALVMNEIVASFLVVLAAWVMLAARQRWTGVVWAGVVLGLATLVRPSTLLLAPLAAAAAPAGLLRKVGAAVLATGLAVVVCLPWTLRNCRVMDGCAFVSTNGGWNLAIGAITDTGRFTQLRGSDGCPVVTGQVQQDRCWAGVGKARIAQNPRQWLALAPKKLAQTFDHESFAIEYLREANPAAWPEARRVAGRQLASGFHRALLVASALAFVALAGFASGARGRSVWLVHAVLLTLVAGLAARAIATDEHAFWPLVIVCCVAGSLPLPGRPALGPVGTFALGTLAATALTHVIFFGEDRYHLIATPALCLLAAAALRAPGAPRPHPP